MDVCAKVRGIFHEKRVGHGGTLDPMATGVLPVFVGRATRAVEFAEHGRKEYVAGLRLGLVTDTQDITGTVKLSLRTGPRVNATEVCRLLGGGGHAAAAGATVSGTMAQAKSAVLAAIAQVIGPLAP